MPVSGGFVRSKVSLMVFPVNSRLDISWHQVADVAVLAVVTSAGIVHGETGRTASPAWSLRRYRQAPPGVALQNRSSRATNPRQGTGEVVKFMPLATNESQRACRLTCQTFALHGISRET